MENVIELKDVCFAYRDSEGALHPALQNINLSFEKGSYTAILGHNGSGKSTLAKLLNLVITGEDGKIDGSIKVFGKEINGTLTEDEEYEIRRRVGMVHQNPDDQIVATTVEEDVAFGPENLGVEPSVIRSTVDEALASVGMTGYENSAWR